MSSDIKASVIILTYRQEATVGRAIESVLRQRCRYRYEILVADDDSPDGTRRVAEFYREKYPDIVRLMPSMPNRGLVGNYFDALEACRGEYIGDCAGDDEWLDPTRLERQIELLDTDRGLSAVFTDVEEYVMDSDGSVKTRLMSERKDRGAWMKERVAGDEITYGALNSVRALPFVLSSALYRKSVVMNALRKNPEIVRMPEMGVEDVPVIAALGRGGDVAYLPVVGLRYYIQGESVSNGLSYQKEYDFYKRVMLGISRIAKVYGFPASALKAQYSRKLSHIAAQARHIGRKDLIADVKEVAHAVGTKIPLRGLVHLFLLRIK